MNIQALMCVVIMRYMYLFSVTVETHHKGHYQVRDLDTPDDCM